MKENITKSGVDLDSEDSSVTRYSKCCVHKNLVECANYMLVIPLVSLVLETFYACSSYMCTAGLLTHTNAMKFSIK